MAIQTSVHSGTAYFNALLSVMRSGLFTPIPAVLTRIRNEENSFPCVYFFEDSEMYYVLSTETSVSPELYSKQYYSLTLYP